MITIAALDHDFHICGLVPSFLFLVDIPTDEAGSFYSGDVHVTLKDKVFQLSSGVRHAAMFRISSFVAGNNTHEGLPFLG